MQTAVLSQNRATLAKNDTTDNFKKHWSKHKATNQPISETRANEVESSVKTIDLVLVLLNGANKVSNVVPARASENAFLANSAHRIFEKCTKLGDHWVLIAQIHTF